MNQTTTIILSLALVTAIVFLFWYIWIKVLDWELRLWFGKTVRARRREAEEAAAMEELESGVGGSEGGSSVGRSKAGSKAGSRVGSQGAKSGKAGSKAGTKAGSTAGSKAGSKAASKTGSKTGSKK